MCWVSSAACCRESNPLSLLLWGAFDWDSPPVVGPLEETAVQTRAVEKFTHSMKLVPWFVESALRCDFPLLCRRRACTSSQRTTACTSSQGRPKGWVPVTDHDGTMKQQLMANGFASFNIPQSLADRCKKIHAGDEVIQVNHQTVVRLFSWHSFFTEPHLNVD